MRTDCQSCGTRFDSPTREDRQSIEGRVLVESWPTTQTCQACELLGVPPPPCPLDGCGSNLRGNDHGAGPVFECEGCDTRFRIEHMRTILLGQAVERIVREADLLRGPPRVHEASIGDLVLRAARKLGVIR